VSPKDEPESSAEKAGRKASPDYQNSDLNGFENKLVYQSAHENMSERPTDQNDDEPGKKSD
jgi:hypothetical protein